MKKTAISLLFAALLYPAHAANVPDGWQSSSQSGFISYSPRELGDSIFMVIALAPMSTGGQPLDSWAQTVAQTLSQSYGTLDAQSTPDYTPPLWNSTHRLTAKNGKTLFANYSAVADKAGTARMVVLLGEETATLINQYGASGGELLAKLLSETPASRLPLAADGLRQRGQSHINSEGDFVFGSYRCHIENGDFPFDVEFELYDTLEYRSDAHDYSEGNFSYDPVRHSVDIENTFNLIDYNIGDEASIVSVYFRDENGKAWIYGEELDEGEATLCEHTGAARNPSPSAEQAAQAEEARFKWVTAPDQGVPLSDIAAILHHVEHKNDSLGIRLEEDHILLLKDGWAYTNLRVPPADLDVAASRANEAQNWRRWKQENGHYLLESQNGWEDAPGQAVRPAQPDERLSGAYSHASSYGNIYTSMHTFKDTLYFAADGTLSSSSSTRGGTTTLNFGTFSADVASDRKNNDIIHYRLDGYTLTRTYPDGSSTRSLVFFWGDDQERIVINGTTYSQENP